MILWLGVAVAWLARAEFKTWLAGGIGVRFRLRLRRDRLRPKQSFERNLVGRPGLEPGTTGLKVRSQAY